MAFGSFSAATGVVQLKLDSQQFDRESKKLNKFLKDNKESFQSMGRTARNFLIGAAAGLAIFVKEASDAEETMNRFNTVFKGMEKTTGRFW